MVFYLFKELSHTFHMHPMMLEVVRLQYKKENPVPALTNEGEEVVKEVALNKVRPPAPEHFDENGEYVERTLAEINPILAKLARYKLKVDLGQDPFQPNRGLLVEVTRIHLDSIQHKAVLPQRGFLEFIGWYDAIFLFPHKDEVMDVIVSKVTRARLLFWYVDDNYISGTVAVEDLPMDDEYFYKEVEELGSEGTTTTTVAKFISKRDPTNFIKVGSSVRIKVLTRSMGNNAYWLTGTMNLGNQNYLGLCKQETEFVVPGEK